MAATELSSDHDDDVDRRDFIYVAAGVASAVGAAFAAWPLVNSMNPAANVLALSTLEVDLSPVELGQSLTVVWRGKPVFIRHRTPAEIEQAVADEKTNLPDPEADAVRAQRPEWLVVIGICTHLGCIPLGQKRGEQRGDFGGWFCPCHGSHYDTAGRIRKGPAPRNLPVPEYAFLDDTTILIG
jgi:ubiquinol-cytochrome c reductase iron-sulfur subunit